MRLILVDRENPQRFHFDPVAMSRPIWELRSGIGTLGEKLAARAGAGSVACFVPHYMADAYRAQTPWPVNDPRTLLDDDLLLVDGRVKASALEQLPVGPGFAAFDADGQLLVARIARTDVAKLDTGSIDALVESAGRVLPPAGVDVPAWKYLWELVLANAGELRDDFLAAGRHGIEGAVEQPSAIRGSASDVYVARGARVHPMVVIDATAGPVYIDEEAEIHPFTRIEGPCYIGRRSVLLGTKCREGNSIGPMCRVGGEIEESIIQGYSNKYHDGFLGHAYVGQWVNLGALTTNSDLKNDYSNVSVVLDGRRPIDTGSTKVGALVGDHAKTSIGTLLNTGAYVGAMSLLVSNGRLMPKFIPSFAWCVEGKLTEGFGKERLYRTARAAMGRRGCQWTPADEALWDEVFRRTAAVRDEAIRASRAKPHG
jgi:UDP-N-acetylglucosamine diphosphorylase / glucose-1-phosphate thymidylyltransferase / UDP-N-acetylgalactosamine diphosphorylase / glucosamine-1-phosphate N-acetyltransferase / galactosamine-1-phosphate N-acetyltransferase